MKRAIFLSFISILVCTTMHAYEFKVNGILYLTIPLGNDVMVGRQTDDCAGKITIPSTVSYDGKEYKVTSIAENAFRDCKDLKEIIIPNSVDYIEICSFMNCSGLEKVSLPENIKIGNYSFEGCKSLTSIKLPTSLTEIPQALFKGCESLQSVVIPNSVTRISGQAFSGCSSMKAIKLPQSVNSIRIDAFAGCQKLLDVYCYATEVPRLSYNAFEKTQYEIITVHVPASVISKYKEDSTWGQFKKIVAIK